MENQQRTGLIATFAQHKVAFNLLMVIMLLSGVWALVKLNTQFFPTFGVDLIRIQVTWSGGTTEDVERAVTEPIEDKLQGLDNVKRINSWSYQSGMSMWIEYQTGTDMGNAMDEVNEAMSQIIGLPESAEEPRIEVIEFRELVARLVISSDAGVEELRALTKQYESELLEIGLAGVTIIALPEQEVAIQVSQSRLKELGLTLDEFSQRVAGASQDLPAGTVGRAEGARQLRSPGQARSELDFANLPLIADAGGRLLRLGDVANIEKRPQDGATKMWHEGRPAVELALYREPDDDALESARTLNAWVAAKQGNADAFPDSEPWWWSKIKRDLPSGVHLKVYDEQWIYIEDRLQLLLKNGLGGLVLIILVLFVFLRGRVAFWVTVGIPVSFMATLAVLYVSGGSINMVSMFALIMGLGIIVDDAIVVGEDALAHYQGGEPPLQAAVGGAQRMWWPVLSSSLTTIAAFAPLMLLTGVFGAILFAIPMVIICVILASLVECFLILPGHLRSSFAHMHRAEPGRMRQRLESGFDAFRDRAFRPLITAALHFRWLTLSLMLGLFVLMIGLLGGGKVGFVFFPQPEQSLLIANVGFVSGTPRERVEAFMEHLEDTLWETDEILGPGLINIAVRRSGVALVPGTTFPRAGEQYGLMQVELIAPDSREVRNERFTEEWKSRVQIPPGLEALAFFSPSGPASGQDVEVKIGGAELNTLKAAAQDLLDVLTNIPGTRSHDEDTPLGREQFVFMLTPDGQASGMTVASIGQQLRTAFDGRLVQTFQEHGDEVEVRVLLPDEERDNLANLETFPIILPSSGSAPLSNLVGLEAERGFERLRHADGQLAITVSADVDEAVANTEAIRNQIENGVFPRLRNQYGVEVWFSGTAEDQGKTMGELLLGVAYAFALIYLVLAWVFGSYGWPLLVMAIIPFGLVGAVGGHWLLGIDMTMLSMFGFFGLSGIVVNDSIILVVFYRELRRGGASIQQALIDAACLRLRAVMLTSLTTIGGLVPLLFETSIQAQFLIPMATSIAFGLGFATVLVLILIPTLLSFYEGAMARLGRSETNEEGTSTYA